MITLENRKFKLCLIDTCIVSEILKNKTTLGNKIVDKFINENYVFCYTIQTIGELKRARDLYDEFFKYLFPMLSFLLKNYNQLIEDELQSYPNKNAENPFLFYFDPLSKENFNLRIKEHLDSEASKAFFENEIKDAPVTLRNILRDVTNWRKTGNQASKKVVDRWAEKEVWDYLNDYKRDFLLNQKKEIDCKLFQSWLMISYVKFYKFYLNPMRKPKVNDLNDILITGAIPYIDAVLCEKELSEIIRQLQRKHDFVKHVEVLNFNDFKIDLELTHPSK